MRSFIIDKIQKKDFTLKYHQAINLNEFMTVKYYWIKGNDNSGLVQRLSHITVNEFDVTFTVEDEE